MALLMQQILHYSLTNHRPTTANHPQTNGLTERLNKTLADIVSIYVDVEHKQWDEVLRYVTYAYNTAVQETTGMTPFSLVYGREATSVLDAMLRHVDHGISDVAPFLQRAEAAREHARVRITSRQDSYSQRYNLRHRHAEFTAGDGVLVWTPVRQRGLSEKLLRRYFGPYRILRRLGEFNYEVIPDGPSRARTSPEVVHVDRLKPNHPRQDDRTAALP